MTEPSQPPAFNGVVGPTMAQVQPIYASPAPAMAYNPQAVGSAYNSGPVQPPQVISHYVNSNMPRGRGSWATCCAFTCLCLGVTMSILIIVGLSSLIVISSSPFQADFTSTERISENVVHGTLPNKLRYYGYKHPYPKERFTAFLCLNIGSIEENDQQLGIAHFIEHMAFDNTRDFPGRFALDQVIADSGGSMNAFTNWRTTCYMVFDMPANTSNLNLAAKIHANQVFHQIGIQANYDVEKGAIYGEDRFRNSSMEASLMAMLANHGGPDYRPAWRNPIGKPREMDYSVANAKDFIDKWYRPEYMRWIVIGDINPSDVEAAAKTYLGPESGPTTPAKAPEKPSLGSVKRVKPVLIKEVDGIDGLELNLIVTRNGSLAPYKYETIKNNQMNMATSMMYMLNWLLNTQSRYPDMNLEELLRRHMAGVEVENLYMLGKELHLFSVLSGSSPSVRNGKHYYPGPIAGNWREDVFQALLELRRLAEDGPSSIVAMAVSEILAQMNSEVVDSWDHIPSTMIAEIFFLGNLDPNATFTGILNREKEANQFLGIGFADVAVHHVQSEARFLYNALHKLAYPSKKTPFDDVLDPSEASISIFLGQRQTSTEANALPQISEKEIMKLVKQVIDARKPGSGLSSGLLSSASQLAAGFGAGFGEVQGVPANGKLVNDSAAYADLNKDLKEPKMTAEKSGILKGRLDSSIGLNLKPRLSGVGDLPSSAPGSIIAQIVAPGGRMSMPSSMAGACDAINMVAPSGHSVFYTNDGSDTSYNDYPASVESSYFAMNGAYPVTVTCNDDSITLTAVLYPGCITYGPRKRSCSPNKVPSSPTVERMRLSMMPWFTQYEIDKAVTALEKELKSLQENTEPMDVIRARLMPNSLYEATGKDPRFAPITPARLAGVNPQSLTAFFRDHFSDPSKLEINVVGDMNINQTAKYMQLRFGKLPKLTPSKVMLSPFDTDPAVQGQLVVQFPAAANNATTKCSLPSYSPNRGYLSVITKSAQLQTFASNPVPLLLAQILLHDHLFTDVRVKKGFGYFALGQMHTPLSAKHWGYVSVIVAPGPEYPPPEAGDPLNLQAAAHAALQSLRSSFDQSKFEGLKKQAKFSVLKALQDPESWLQVMYGMSIPCPAWWGCAAGSSIKPVSVANIADEIDKVTYAQVKDIVSTPSSQYGVVYAFLETIGAHDDAANRWGSCFSDW